MIRPESGYAFAAGEAIEEWEIGGDVLRLLVSAEQSAGVVTVVSGLIHGGGPPLHVHDAEDEVVMVLDGTLAYRIGKREGSVGTGGLLWMPRQLPHAFANASDKPSRFLAVVTPGGIEELFRAQSRYLASLPPGAPLDPAVMASLDGTAGRPAIGPPLR